MSDKIWVEGRKYQFIDGMSLRAASPGSTKLNTFLQGKKFTAGAVKNGQVLKIIVDGVAYEPKYFSDNWNCVFLSVEANYFEEVKSSFGKPAPKTRSDIEYLLDVVYQMRDANKIIIPAPSEFGSTDEYVARLKEVVVNQLNYEIGLLEKRKVEIESL